MNRVILMGRLVRDPEIRVSTGDKPMTIAKYTLAVNRQTNAGGADFINCTALGRNGEFAEKYLKKGTKILVEGHWQTGSFTNKDGNKVYTNDCLVDRHEFAESKSQAEPNKETPPMPTGADGFMDIPPGLDEELPFN